MGAMFFILFFGVLFFIALFFIIVSVVLLIVRYIKVRRGRPVKKRWLVIPVILLVTNSILAMLPVGYIAFLHYANSSNSSTAVYADSGISLNWPLGEYESTTSWFEMDGVKYVRLQQEDSEGIFFFAPTKDKHGEAIANIRYHQAENNLFNNLMTLLLTGSSRDQLKVSTIYPLVNDNNFELLEVQGTAGSGVFCPEAERASIIAYYADLSNYDTQHLTCSYSVYSDRESSRKRRNTPIVSIETKITFAPDIFKELRQVIDTGQDMQQINVPQKYIEMDEAAQAGTPIFGYAERKLLSYSKDNLSYKHITLALLEGQVYIVAGSGDHALKGYSLSEDMNQYLITTVFADESLK